MSTRPLSPEIKQGVQLWIRKQIIFLVVVAALMFLSAGTLRWVEGWSAWD